MKWKATEIGVALLGVTRRNARCVGFDGVSFVPKADNYASESLGFGEGAGSEENHQEADRHGRIV